MKRFSCPNCNNEIYFENSSCVSCQSQIGYLSSRHDMLAAPFEATVWVSNGVSHVRCSNFQAIGCNWFADEKSGSGFCRSCQHTRTIPDLSVDGNALRWSRLESAKRSLFYAIDRFGLSPEQQSGHCLADLWFEFKADEVTPTGTMDPVLTGHDRGLITLNIAESDDAEREKRRTGMGEPYRTLIGHFRHEIGHYYWDQLVADGPHLEGFRRIFGDERQYYGEALKIHYQNGAPANWEQNYVSAYATSHPWEDFAETWAHAFHMVDGLETAEAYGLANRLDGTWKDTQIAHTSPYQVADIGTLIKEWVPVTVAMNAMNRSIGQPDFYPFVLSQSISEKMQFVLHIIHGGQPI